MGIIGFCVNSCDEHYVCINVSVCVYALNKFNNRTIGFTGAPKSFKICKSHKATNKPESNASPFSCVGIVASSLPSPSPSLFVSIV